MAKKKAESTKAKSSTKKKSTSGKKGTTKKAAGSKKATVKKATKKTKAAKPTKKSNKGSNAVSDKPQPIRDIVRERRGPGRPLGSKNKTKEPPSPPPEQKDPLKGKNVQNVAISSIDLKDRTFQFRGDNLRVGPLVESLKAHGQQIPVALREHPDPDGSGKRYQIISGFRRITAINEIGWSKVAAIVREDLKDDDQEAFKASIIENEARKTYNDLDRGRAVVGYRKQGYPVKELEKIFGLQERQLARLRSLVEFPQVLQDAIDNDQISSTHALALNKAHNKYGDDFDLEEWIDAILEETLSVRQLNKAIRDEFAGTEKDQQETFELLKPDKDSEGNLKRYVIPRRYLGLPDELSDDEKAQVRGELQRIMEMYT